MLTMYVDREDKSEDEKVSPSRESNVCATDFLATHLLILLLLLAS